MALNILVIDDVEKNLQDALEKIRKELGGDGTVSQFPTNQGGLVEGVNEMHEVRLKRDLLSLSSSVTLIVADRDLSGIEKYSGLSESTVQRVADSLGIPECGYARGESATINQFVMEAGYRETCIRIGLDGDFAKRVVAIAKGFDSIEQALTARQGKETAKPAVSKVLAAILGMPHLSDKMSLYASGDHSRLSSLIRPVKEEQSDNQRRLSCFLGYWLWDSILRFPGIVVDEIAASSYLNISEDEIKKREVQALLADALYKGPFAAAKSTMWWRSGLDDLVGQSGEPSGRSFIAKQLGRDVSGSQCCENPDIKAGYYCFLTQRPVSYENSKPGLAWFPRGADLTRISKSAYDEQVPWL